MRIALIIGVWLVALTGGALLYIAKQKAETLTQDDTAPAIEAAAAPAAEQAVSFSLPNMDGEQQDFANWEGRHRVLNFWATWCAPCRREIPLLKRFQTAQGGSGIQVIGIAVDFPEDVSRYADKAEFNYPILVGQEDAMAIAETSGVPFIGLPFTMIVGRNGELIDTHMGEIFEDDLEKLVDTLARLDAGELSIEAAREIL